MTSMVAKHGGSERRAPRAPPVALDYAEVYRAHWMNTREGLFSVQVVDGNDFVFESLNPAHEKATGLSNVTIAGRRPHEVLDPVTAQRVLSRYRQCLRDGEPVSYYETLELPSGNKDWETTLTPVCDASGRIVRLMGRGRELTDRLHPAEAITPSHRELRRALDLSPKHVAILDRSGDIVYVNRAWRRFANDNGSTRGNVGDNYLEICRKAEANGVHNVDKLTRKLIQLLEGDIQTFAFPYDSADRHFVLQATRITLDGVVLVMASHQDVTEVVETQRELVSATERLLAIQEEERARIAVELHDSTSQHLVAIGLGLAALRRGRARRGVLDDMRKSLAEAHKEIRTLTYLLHPPKLSQLGLVATLRTFLEGFRRRTGLSVVTTLTGDLDGLPFDLQKTVFRIVQEALANTHRHAMAKRVSVEIAVKSKELRVTIVDDGQAPEGPVVNGVGIHGMEARVAQFKGRLTVARRPFGMVIDAYIPRSGFERMAHPSPHTP